MEEGKKAYSFDRRIVSVDDRPNIYVVRSTGKVEVSTEATSRKTEMATGQTQEKVTRHPVSFFGHRIAKLLASDQAATDEFRSIDQELESGLKTVRERLQRSQVSKALQGKTVWQEEIKHRRFIEERNRAQEALCEDIVRYHGEFGTGLSLDDLRSLHDLMTMEADHEVACSAEGSLHELVECNLLSFLRRKAGEQAWRHLEGYLERFNIPFPMSPSMKDPSRPLRNEKIREERKKLARDDLFKMPAEQLAELILGNVPMWVYSYPDKDSYLWQLTVLQGVAAGLAARYLIQYLSIWEENSVEILSTIQQEFMDQIREIRQRGESTTDLSETVAVSMELQRISREEIPNHIWKYISSKLVDS